MVLTITRLIISIKLITEHFKYAQKCGSTESVRSILDEPMSTEMLLGDKCPRGLIWSTSREIFPNTYNDGFHQGDPIFLNVCILPEEMFPNKYNDGFHQGDPIFLNVFVLPEIFLNMFVLPEEMFPNTCNGGFHQGDPIFLNVFVLPDEMFPNTCNDGFHQGDPIFLNVFVLSEEMFPKNVMMGFTKEKRCCKMCLYFLKKCFQINVINTQTKYDTNVKDKTKSLRYFIVY